MCVGMTGGFLSIELLPELPEHLRASQKLRAGPPVHLLSMVTTQWNTCHIKDGEISVVILALQKYLVTICCHLLVERNAL